MFHATSGDPLPFSRFQGGERPFVVDDKIQWRSGGSGDWENYLTSVFTWAGSASLQAYETTPTANPRGGDVVVEGGFPGHAVLIVDVAQSESQTYVLLAESYMPAQDFHIELGPIDGWWPWGPDLNYSTWDFDTDDLRRWNR